MEPDLGPVTWREAFANGLIYLMPLAWFAVFLYGFLQKYSP